MNSRITNRAGRWIAALFLPVLLMGAGDLHAQVVVSNPLEWAVLAEGNELID